MPYFHSKQVFPAPKQTKGVNIEDAQSTKLFHWYFTSAKPETNGDWQRLCSDKNIGNALGIGVHNWPR